MKNRISGFYWIDYYGTWLVGEWDSDGKYWLLPGIIMTCWDEDFDEIIETPLSHPINNNNELLRHHNRI